MTQYAAVSATSSILSATILAPARASAIPAARGRPGHLLGFVVAAPRGRPSFLAPLLMQSATVRTVAVTITLIHFGQAMRQAEMAQTMELAGEMERRRQRFMTTASDRPPRAGVTRREED